MIRKTIGTILILVGATFIVFLISRGLLFPHVIGPTTLIVIGGLLLTVKKRAK